MVFNSKFKIKHYLPASGLSIILNLGGCRWHATGGLATAGIWSLHLQGDHSLPAMEIFGNRWSLHGSSCAQSHQGLLKESSQRRDIDKSRKQVGNRGYQFSHRLYPVRVVQAICAWLCCPVLNSVWTLLSLLFLDSITTSRKRPCPAKGALNFCLPPDFISY